MFVWTVCVHLPPFELIDTLSPASMAVVMETAFGVTDAFAAAQDAANREGLGRVWRKIAEQ